MTSSAVTAAHVELGMPHAVNILELLSQVPDPRHRRGRQHRLEVILTLTVAAVTAGAESLVGIWDWAQDVGPALLRRVQMSAPIPSETTIRRVLEACDPVMFNLLCGAWMRYRWDGTDGSRVVVVDGKTLRRSGGTDGCLPHLVSVKCLGFVPHRFRSGRMQIMPKKFTDEEKSRAVRMVHEQRPST